MKKILYQLNSAGKVKVWMIEVIKISPALSNIVIHHGQQGGKMVEDVTPITEGKSAGRSNATSIYEQAVKDAETEFNKKVKKGYVEDINNIKAKGETHSINEPMKGFPYHPKGKAMKGKTLDELNLRGKKVGIQRKLDGWRARIKVTPTEVVFYSSSGDIIPTFEHVEESLRETYDRLKLSGDIVLDGEFYSMKLGFQTVASACGTRVHITPEKKALRDQIEFHLFDIVSDLPYAEGWQNRRNVIKPFYGGPIKKVETFYEICEDAMIQTYLEKFLQEGFEGVMIRTLDQPYEFKRTKQLTKFKPYIDEEYQVIGFKRSITGDTLGSLECVMENGTKFFANPMGEIGTDVARKEIWDNQQNYIGKWLNCRFMEYTEVDSGSGSGVPRHPRAMYFRKGKSKD